MKVFTETMDNLCDCCGNFVDHINLLQKDVEAPMQICDGCFDSFDWSEYHEYKEDQCIS